MHRPLPSVTRKIMYKKRNMCYPFRIKTKRGKHMSEEKVDPQQIYKDKMIQMIDEFREKLINEPLIVKTL